MNEVYYHGTTTALNIDNYILPATKTSILREETRQRNKDVVWFTKSTLSAAKYAKKAALKYGGTPIIYIVAPIGAITLMNNYEYTAEKAAVIGTIPVY